MIITQFIFVALSLGLLTASHNDKTDSWWVGGHTFTPVGNLQPALEKTFRHKGPWLYRTYFSTDRQLRNRSLCGISNLPWKRHLGTRNMTLPDFSPLTDSWTLCGIFNLPWNRHSGARGQTSLTDSCVGSLALYLQYLFQGRLFQGIFNPP
jgi:hypothetical protein